MKHIFIIFVLACLLLTLLLPGCKQAQVEITPVPAPSPATTQPEQTPAARPAPTPAKSPVTVEVSFPDGAPPLNQEAKLICIVKAAGIKDMSVDVKLPEGFELISGNLSWTGDVSTRDGLEVINTTVRAVKVGNWTIEATTYIDPEKHGGFGGTGKYPIYVSVLKDSAEWGKYPPWYGEGGHPVEVVPSAGPAMTIKDFSISHAPLLNEPADLTLTLSPQEYMPDITARIILPEGTDLIDGTLEWHGDLQAGVPVTLSATIAFRKTGNWCINGGYWQWVGKDGSWGVYRSIYLIIGIDQSSFGQAPEPDIEELPIPPATPLP